MCGIAGSYGSYDISIVKTMLNSIKHRGPDSEGVWGDSLDKITFGHVRLSIIDTSLGGHQPMSFNDERYWITFNGEIYNYRELKVELINLGCIFRTNTDTEVILAAFAFWGKTFVNKIVGMFSFAIYDKLAPDGNAKLYLYRDRFGIKPLLYSFLNNVFYFSSEISAFLKIPGINPILNKDSLIEYLAFGSVIQPNTILDDIKTLPAGHFLEVFENKLILVKYWDIHEQTILLRKELKDISYEKVVLEVRSLLNKATKYNLVSDVEIGVFLSGGVDSTAILGLINNVTSNQISTFSIGFENRLSFMDETKFAKIAADYFQTKHKSLIIDSNNSELFFDHIISNIDQPSIDGTNTWLVSRFACNDVKVAISGIGGDELFAGYPHFRSIYYNFNKFLYNNKLLYNITELLHSFRPNFLTLKLLSRFSNNILLHSNQRRVLENYEISKYVNAKWTHNFKNIIFNIYKNWQRDDADIIQQATYIEIMGYLQSTLLRDSDVMSMAHGLEIRPLLLDHKLAEYVYAIPAKYKISHDINKKLLLDSVKDIFPAELKNRKKMGFELPFISWISGPLNNKFLNLFQSEQAQNIFDINFIEKQICLIKKGSPTITTWTIGVLIAWLQKNSINIK
jgi:asparagine synthase (glutamine-hydrolysing)